ncbi:MAG: nucleotide sugar dehydrogenase [Nitrospirae bacterium]|nr:nucleotide sugar dehydrogenase [Nitrospirota bacterium]
MYRELLKKDCKVGVWGTGYIGFSTMAFFAKQGVRTVGYDVSPEKVKVINRGGYIIKELKTWLNFPVGPLARKGYLRATSDHNDLARQKAIVHFVAIPTEKEGEPYFDILKDVIRKICDMVRNNEFDVMPLVIIESTLSPRTTDRIILPLFKKEGIVIGRDILFGVSPRRDWFVEGGKNLMDLDRVFGGYDERSKEAVEEVLGIVCKKLHAASSCYVSEMVKSFENAYRHAEITLANQISLAYPSQNIREALELVGTKWNIGTYRPGFGTGGYCIPVASKYVIDGAERPEKLSILKETIRTDTEINLLIARSIARRGAKKVAVLGLSYKGNLKVNILSPTIPFVAELVKKGVDVKVFDPYFTDAEVRKILGVEPLKFPRGLKDCDMVVLVVDHDEYKVPGATLVRNMKKRSHILDNTGLWKEHRDKFGAAGLEYHLAGDADWI